jgi:hypothetical protein
MLIAIDCGVLPVIRYKRPFLVMKSYPKWQNNEVNILLLGPGYWKQLPL